LWLVGGSSSHRYETTLVDFAKHLGLGEAVHVTGSVDQDELVSYYRHADVFVSTSEHEGFGVPLIEAMWQSVPVVARATSAVAGTVGDAGLLLEPTDAPDSARVAAAIHRVLDDGQVRADLVKRGRARAEHFSLDRGREAFRAALRPLLER
nr:glycosyltransferase [Actinomycetota bacterium]